MRIFVVLALSLIFGLPVGAQNGLWGTSGNNAPAGQGSSGISNSSQGAGQSIGQGSGQSSQRYQGNGKRRRHRSGQGSSTQSPVSAASSVKSYDDNASVKPVGTSQPATTTNTQQIPAQQAPVQLAPSGAPAHKQSGVQSY